ncbi:MAG: UDP-N-acetylmuramate dehydrogenase [Elusimicrobiota bacterium]
MKVFPDACLKKYSGFKTGGKADFLVKAGSRDDLKKIVAEFCPKPISVIGRGFNTLISERGVKGVVVVLKRDFTQISAHGSSIRAGGGALLPRILDRACNLGLSGLEFLAGVPGTAGGALITNCGACGHSLGDFVHSIEVFDCRSAGFRNLSFSEVEFSYRNASIPGKMFVTAIELGLKTEDKNYILQKIRENMDRKAKSQPLFEKSCGCIFKNPLRGPSAGELIEKCGMKGARVGGAEVSFKHANFIINKGSATSKDILALIKKIKKAVNKKYGVELHTEIKFMGRGFNYES